MSTPFLVPEQLAERWNTTLATLSQWRWNGKGPLFTKIGRSILYRVEHVEHFEQQHIRRDTTCTGYGTSHEETFFKGHLRSKKEEIRFYVKDDRLTHT